MLSLRYRLTKVDYKKSIYLLIPLLLIGCTKEVHIDKTDIIRPVLPKLRLLHQPKEVELELSKKDGNIVIKDYDFKKLIIYTNRLKSQNSIYRQEILEYNKFADKENNISKSKE